jgi:hypothetical protein
MTKAEMMIVISSSYRYKAFLMILLLSFATIVSSAFSWNVHVSKSTVMKQWNTPMQQQQQKKHNTNVMRQRQSPWSCHSSQKLLTNALSMSNYDDDTGQDEDDTAEWKAVLAAFKMYKAAYGDLRIPLRFIVPSIPPWPSKLHCTIHLCMFNH